MNVSKSHALFARAGELFPGGVNSPVRAFRAVGGEPLFIERAAGPYVFDVDGNQFVDHVLSWGPLILGHAPASVVEAVTGAASRGTSFGAPNALEIELAELIRDQMPAVEMLRFVNSGTEATMSALRLARAFTGRAGVVKFAGCYHGHVDALLAKAGSGVATLALPDSPGVPASTASHTMVVPYNDLNALATCFESAARDIAAVVVEPVAGNMGVIPPKEGFLQGLREITEAHDALLVFDEVMTAFRVHPGGAQALYGVTPDLTTLGKVIGGGLPVGAFGGRRDVMELLAPQGPVYQAGTLSGNPLAMAAGAATLTELRSPGRWDQIAATTARITETLAEVARNAGVNVILNRVGTMFTVFFTDDPVTDWTSAQAADGRRYGAFFRAMLERGVYLTPSPFEACFVSAAHGDREVEWTGRASAHAFRAVA